MLSKTKTKIIATIGPACQSKEMIEKLILAGTTMFRLNTSHAKIEELEEIVTTIRETAKKLDTQTPIMIDLQGPKIRVGRLIEPIELNDGEEVLLSYALEQTDKNIIPIDYKNLIKDVNTGEKMLLDDGKLELKVIDKKDNIITAKVIHGGILSSRKGLNMPGTDMCICAITDRDIEFIKFAIEKNIDYLALSFVRTKEDLFLAHHYMEKYNGSIPLIAKIEKPQALDNIDEIIEKADGIMVARGDLGIELSVEKLPIVQKQLITKANEARKLVIVATQMLESMIEQQIPTRAETSDIANAIIDRTDAIMLSGETAVGKNPDAAVKMMAEIAKNVEESDFCPVDIDLKPNLNFRVNSQAIVSAAIKMVHELEVCAIVAFTKNGYTSKLLSKQRPEVPTICITDTEKTCRKLNIYWGLCPMILDCDGHINPEVLSTVDKFLLDNTFLKKGDKVIVTGSIPHLLTGATNFIRIHTIGENLKN